MYQTIRIRGKRMLPVDLSVEDITIRVLSGQTKLIHFGRTTHEGEAAILLTFCPESKYEKSSFIVQGTKVFNLSGKKPGFVMGFLTKTGSHVTIEPAKAPNIN